MAFVSILKESLIDDIVIYLFQIRNPIQKHELEQGLTEEQF